MRYFYSQQREDEWIAANLPLPRKGFYVDIGCAHPFTTSNTAFLRDRKWHGLAVDGNRIWEKDWEGIPAFRCAVIANEPEVSFLENHESPWLSRIGASGGSQRCTISIEDLLSMEQVEKIDFLSIDVEGNEFDILSHLDFARHQPTIIIAEYNTADLGNDLRLKPLLVSLGYSLKFENQINMIFKRDAT